MLQIPSMKFEQQDVDTVHLGTLKPGQGGVVLHLQGPISTVLRLQEMGLIEGSDVQILNEAPFGKDPIVIKVRGSFLALRRQEANCVLLKKSRT